MVDAAIQQLLFFFLQAPLWGVGSWVNHGLVQYGIWLPQITYQGWQMLFL